MNDKTNNPQEKIETAIDSEELRDEDLDQVTGGLIKRHSKLGTSVVDHKADDFHMGEGGVPISIRKG